MVKKIYFLLVILITSSAYAQVIQIPELNSPVTDLTNTLYDSQLADIENKLKLFEKTNTGQIAVLIIATTGEESIEEYSIRLAEEWKIGSAANDDGIILLIAKNDRKLRIEVGYGYESTITDAEAKYIIDNLITPQFKNGDFYNGIKNGIDRIIGLIIGISQPLDEIYEDDTAIINSSNDPMQNTWIIILFAIVTLSMFVPIFLIKSKFSIMIIFLLSLFGLEFLIGILADDLTISWMFMMLTGIFNFIPFLMNLIGTLTGKKKHWNFSSGSSSSSGWSSSSSSSSSFSGGGGSFGGGGASGSW